MLISKINKSKPFRITVFLVVAFLYGCDINGSEQRIGYIDMKAVLTESGLSQQEKMHLEQVGRVLKSADDEAEALYKKIETDKLKELRKNDQLLLQEVWRVAQQSARNLITNEAIKAAKVTGEKKGLQIMHYGPLILSSEHHTDITDQVVAALKDTRVKFEPLPRLLIALPENAEKNQRVASGLISIK